MEVFIIVLAVVSIFVEYMNDSASKEKKPFPPIEKPAPEQEPSETADIGFEIPPLQGAPKPGDGVYREPQNKNAAAARSDAPSSDMEEEERRLCEQRDAYRSNRAALTSLSAEKCRDGEEHRDRLEPRAPGTDSARPFSIPPVTPQGLAAGIIYAEILGKPKALRGGNMVPYRSSK